MIKTILPADSVEGAATDVSLPHILLVLDQFPESLGGGERVALKLGELLPKYGYRASILTFGIHPKSPVLRHAKCPIYLLPLQRVYDFNAVRASFAFRDFLRAQQIQIVQTFFESSDLWAGFITKAMSKSKLIWSRRDMGILRASKHRIAYRLMAAMPDAVFAVSDQVRQHCVEVDHIDPNRVFTIYNGLDLARWPSVVRSMKTSGDLIVTTVGNVRRVKGHDLLIQAAALIVEQYPQVHFNVVGEILEPHYFAELQKLIADLGLSRNFHFVGGVSDLSDYLVDTDIFVLPSRSEGFSNAVIEAMASSLPVVATNVGGNAEAVIDGINGYIVEANDVVALSTAIKNLIGDPFKAFSMGATGRDLVIEKFTADAMMRAVAARFNALLSTRE
jgi:glycosyltransferase involved in cell wall biosynthesis